MSFKSFNFRSLNIHFVIMMNIELWGYVQLEDIIQSISSHY